MRQVLKKPLKRFVVLSYIIFFVLFLAIGLSMLLGAPESIIFTLQVIAAWSSTFSFIFLFRRIYPGIRLTDFIKQQFAPRLRFSVLSIIVLIQVGIIAVTALLITMNTGIQGPAFSYTGLGIMVLAFLDNLVRGPLGEELGWRGYALNELQKKYSPLKSALIVGVLWGFWHTPLWFATGYTGMELITYILLFMIGILSFSIIVTLFYNLNKNLIIPIVIHQLFNFSLVMVKGDLLNILGYVMLSYLVVAILLICINPKKILY
ncbi:CPBP family intramembrane glutamic endopeptidase [Paucisalibacillus globulus]|uniref:CPBP family intramembrane glutamic endopeptidase n=1 Tax=Paucisalibacillus globulus TaxID=351095 RepID=UPI0003F8E401|nr:type II CAAX endopeptidase family protein [Paucisalibacillus globulus]